MKQIHAFIDAMADDTAEKMTDDEIFEEVLASGEGPVAVVADMRERIEALTRTWKRFDARVTKAGPRVKGEPTTTTGEHGWTRHHFGPRYASNDSADGRGWFLHGQGIGLVGCGSGWVETEAEAILWVVTGKPDQRKKR